MKVLLLAAVLAALGLGPLFAERAPEAAEVEGALVARMNTGPHGTVTRDVACRKAPSSTFTCVLTSTEGTRIDVQVRRNGGEWTATWEPLSG